MKCLYSLGLLFFLFQNSISAQVEFGLKAGINHSFEKKKNSDGTSFNTAKLYRPAFSLTSEIGISKSISVYSELGYSSVGGRIYKIDFETNKDYPVTTRLSHIIVPLLLKVNHSQFSFGLGPQIGILVSASLHNGFYTINMIKEYSRVDLSAILNFDYTYKNKYLIGLRSQSGLTDFRAYLRSADSKASDTNHATQLFFGYKF